MHPIIYDVAVSLDGYISGPSEDISMFAHNGPVVDDYLARLDNYATAIMGRATYEFGYGFGLKPGQNPYPNMKTIVFSQRIDCPETGDVVVRRSTTEEDIRHLKTSSRGPVYLCGGGAFAGWLLQRGLIDRLLLKRAPCIYGDGVRLFGGVTEAVAMSRISAKAYDNGYLLEEFIPEREA